MGKEIIIDTGILPHEDYLNLGGRLTESDYEVIANPTRPRDERQNQSQITKAILQVKPIEEFCGIYITGQQKRSYETLRVRIPPEGASKPENPRTVPVCQMTDQELVRQIVLATEGDGEKYQIITSRYPTLSKN